MEAVVHGAPQQIRVKEVPNARIERPPDDLPAFCERIVQELTKAPWSIGPAGRP